jgi:drug/metabolite transporter (DMT)-like permease
VIRIISMIGFVIIWSTGFIVAKFAAPHANLQFFLLLRFALTTSVMGGAAAASSVPWPKGKALLAHLAAGAMMQGVYLCASYWAIAHGMPAGIMALLGALQPLFTALYLVIATRVRLGARTWFGLLVGFSGVACVLAPKIAAGAPGSLTVISIVAALLSVIAITAGALLQKTLPQVDLRSAASVQNAGAACIAAIMVLAFGVAPWDNSAILWGILAWSVLVPSVIGTTLLMWMMRQGDATKVTALMLLVPPLAAVQGFLFFGETLSAMQITGFGLALLGVLFTQFARSQTVAPGTAAPRIH